MSSRKIQYIFAGHSKRFGFNFIKIRNSLCQIEKGISVIMTGTMLFFFICFTTSPDIFAQQFDSESFTEKIERIAMASDIIVEFKNIKFSVKIETIDYLLENIQFSFQMFKNYASPSDAVKNYLITETKNGVFHITLNENELIFTLKEYDSHTYFLHGFLRHTQFNLSGEIAAKIQCNVLEGITPQVICDTIIYFNAVSRVLSLLIKTVNPLMKKRIKNRLQTIIDMTKQISEETTRLGGTHKDIATNLLTLNYKLKSENTMLRRREELNEYTGGINEVSGKWKSNHEIGVVRYIYTFVAAWLGALVAFKLYKKTTDNSNKKGKDSMSL